LKKISRFELKTFFPFSIFLLCVLLFLLENETVWMSQAGMAELYQTTPQNITIHIGNLYEEGELEPEAT
jgi:hypothetical protein